MLMSRKITRLLAIGMAVAALLLAFVSSAYAGPSEPVLHFDSLRAALANSPSHHLNGYMKTVVEGSTITTIPLTVLSVPLTGGPDDGLILFEATGTLIAKYGGIVAGMSGSPVYVDDGTGTDKLVGAVSYGDYFTLGGTGLATPIDAMSEMENTYTAAAPLSTPVITANGVIRRVVVAPNPQDYAGAAAAGAFVARPLASVFIGGLRPSSAGYKALAKDLSAHGVALVSLGSPLAAGSDDGTGGFTTTMTAGASIAALASRGDLWVGGIGTVTYANDGNVLAFGHPAYWSGATNLYMANAWIEGVWPNSFEPYKVGDPGAIRGTITQDRSAGILGKSDLRRAETTITARAVNLDTSVVSTSAVYIPRALLANGIGDSMLVNAAAYVAGSNLFDQRMQSGSAHTTTTVTLLDGDATRTVVMANYSSSSTDIASAASLAVQTAISTLQSVLPYGIEKPQILSIDLAGEYSATRTDAQIVRVDAPNGLHIGANRIRVDALVYGVAATRTVEATLAIPVGTPLGGTITAQAASAVSDNSMSLGDMWGVTFKRKTIAGLVAQLNATVPDTAMVITYQPSTSSSSSDSMSDDELGSPSAAMNTISTQVISPWPIAGRARSYATVIKAAVLPNPVTYGGFVEGIVGEIDGPSAATTVSLYATAAGSSAETLVATTTATPFGGALVFEFPLMQSYTRNTTFRVHVDAADTSTGADTSVSLAVGARVSLKSSAAKVRRGKSVNLSASVFPATSAGGTAVFEQASGKKWVKIGSKTLTASGSKAVASLSWKPTKGTHKVRVRYLGGAYNAATISPAVTIAVK